MLVVKAGVVYFAAVFAAGFVLGAVRSLWVVPQVGARMAELMEAPIMLTATILAARWTVHRFVEPSPWPARLGMGCIALFLMLVAEFGLVLWVRGISIKAYFATRDPLSGTVYYLLLGTFAVMPLLLAR
jgi:hypothetical protein